MLCVIVMKKIRNEVMSTLCTTVHSWDSDSWETKARFLRFCFDCARSGM